MLHNIKCLILNYKFRVSFWQFLGVGQNLLVPELYWHAVSHQILIYIVSLGSVYNGFKSWLKLETKSVNTQANLQENTVYRACNRVGIWTNVA